MKAVFERISVRRYQDRPVEKEKILALLRAAMAAPSAGNQQPWEFYVVTDREKIRALSEVTPYSILHKIAVLIGVVSSMLSTPMWAANGEALRRGEVEWVKKSTRRIALISLGLSVAATLGIFVLLKPALYILTDGVVEADYLMLLPLCAMQILSAVTNPYFMVLNAGRIIKFQIVTYIIYAAVSLPLKFVIGARFGAAALTWVGVIAYLVLLTVPTVYMALLYIKKQSKPDADTE